MQKKKTKFFFYYHIFQKIALGFALSLMEADVVALAVAGVVRDSVFCQLTNATWSVDLRAPELSLPVKKTVLMNDFVAQAFGCRTY